MRIRWPAAVLMLCTVALAGCAGTPAALFRSGPDAGPAATAQYGDALSLPADGRDSATLAVVSGATTLTVGTAAMPGRLVRVTTPADSGVRPQLVQAGGRVRLVLDSSGRGGPSAVSVVLNSAVRWRLQLRGGTTRTMLVLDRGEISGIDVTAGSSLISMTLPRPTGTTTITLAGGASQVRMMVPAGIPVRVRLAGGAATATVGTKTLVGVAGGTMLTSPGWAGAANRYDIAATAGVSTITVIAGPG